MNFKELRESLYKECDICDVNTVRRKFYYSVVDRSIFVSIREYMEHSWWR